MASRERNPKVNESDLLLKLVSRSMSCPDVSGAKPRLGQPNSPDSYDGEALNQRWIQVLDLYVGFVAVAHFHFCRQYLVFTGGLIDCSRTN
jgi:hypothetical protein